MVHEQYPVIPEADSFFLKGNSMGILLCHGFLGTPQSVKELGEAIAAHGYTVSCPRLPGHGTHFKDLEQFVCDDWFARIEEAYKDLKQACSSVIVIGQSMGGTLSLDLASRYPDIQGIVLINPAIDIPAFEPYRDQPYSAYVTEGQPDIKKEDALEITYEKAPVKAYQQLLKYMNAVDAKLADVRCPVVCFQSLEDHVVPPGNTDYILRRVQSERKRKYELHNSYHIASMDHELDFIAEKAIQFAEETLPLLVGEKL
ncbi:alpha/beta hydrolase [Planococcus sp. SE5232]|uniref:alpha/beta hydrolase n=1 Tax=unclassified Planococcus (in: firmicutes) TaxID=2662419 RepID=UPI003D6BF249